MFSPVASRILDDKRVSSFSDSLRPLYVHGDLLIKGFVVDPASAWEELCANNAGLFNHLILSLIDLVPELKTKKATKVIPEYSLISPHALGEHLADLLSHGGCYEKFRGTRSEARKLAQAFAAFLVEPHRDHARIFQVKEPWTPWFSCMIWAMYLIANPISHTWFLVCATDED